MARPSRNWVPKTFTISKPVAKAIAMRAVELGIDPGTVVDMLFWNAFLKPDEERLGKGGFSEEELERIFAEEALEHLTGKQALEPLGEQIPHEDEDVEGTSSRSDRDHARYVQRLVIRWQKTRYIDVGYRQAVFQWLVDLGIVPSILRANLVDEDWFASE